FNAGETAKVVSVAVNADAINESAETFFVNLTSPVNARLANSTGIGTIGSNLAANLSIDDVTVTEGEGGGTTNAVFNVTLSARSSQTVTVNYATANNSATAVSDYTAQSGTLTFNPGDISKVITVQVIADCSAEQDE